MNDSQLRRQVERRISRLKKAEDEQSTILAQTVFTGVLGLVLVLPVIGGAYLGHWVDSKLEGYSVRWTLGFIMLGLIIGAFNVYWFIKER